MTDIQKGRLEVNHTFPDKEMLLMRVAEEAILRGVNIFCSRSDLRNYTCTGSKFCVKAHHTEQNGWTVSVANVHECDEFGSGALNLDTGGYQEAGIAFSDEVDCTSHSSHHLGDPCHL